MAEPAFNITAARISEARTHLSELGERKADGEEIVVTKPSEPPVPTDRGRTFTTLTISSIRTGCRIPKASAVNNPLAVSAPPATLDA